MEFHPQGTMNISTKKERKRQGVYPLPFSVSILLDRWFFYGRNFWDRFLNRSFRRRDIFFHNRFGNRFFDNWNFLNNRFFYGRNFWDRFLNRSFRRRDIFFHNRFGNRFFDNWNFLNNRFFYGRIFYIDFNIFFRTITYRNNSAFYTNCNPVEFNIL